MGSLAACSDASVLLLARRCAESVAHRELDDEDDEYGEHVGVQMPLGPIPTQTAWRTTGKTRLRIGLFRRVVTDIQEVRQIGGTYPDGFVASSEEHRWRRIRASDLAMHVPQNEGK